MSETENKKTTDEINQAAAEVGDAFTKDEIKQLREQYDPEQVAKRAAETTNGLFEQVLESVSKKWDHLSSETQKELQALSNTQTEMELSSSDSSVTPQEVVFGSQLLTVIMAAVAIGTSDPNVAVIGGASAAGASIGALEMLKNLKEKYDETIGSSSES